MVSRGSAYLQGRGIIMVVSAEYQNCSECWGQILQARVMWARRGNVGLRALGERIVSDFSSSSNLDMYCNMLQTYNRTLKKPTQLVKDNQLSTLNGYLSQPHGPGTTLRALLKIRGLRLFNVEALDMVEGWVGQQWDKLTQQQRIWGCVLLGEQGRQAIFQANKLDLEQSVPRIEDKQMRNLSNVLYRYCFYIFWSSIELVHKFDPVYTLGRQHSTMWARQHSYIDKVDRILTLDDTRITQLPATPIASTTGTSLIRNSKDRKFRSNLEIEVEALLVALEYRFEREVEIYGFTVDFLIGGYRKEEKGKQINVEIKCIVEVMGMFHYTVEGKLFGKDILRAAMLEHNCPVVMVHVDKLNSMKSMQQKLDYIRNSITAATTK